MNDNSISAKVLIDLLMAEKPRAEVENDEGLYAKPCGEVEADEDGLCSLVVHPVIGESLDMGNFRIEVGGVVITVGREVEGPDGEYEFSGKEIVYGDGMTEADVVAAIGENVRFPEYDSTEYTDVDFDADDVEDSVCVDGKFIYAEDDDGNIYRYDDADELPEDQTVVEECEAIHKLVEAWADNGGEADGEMMENFGPWS